MKEYRMKCPNCGYKFKLILYTEKYEVERCPICGHRGKFKEFRDDKGKG